MHKKDGLAFESPRLYKAPIHFCMENWKSKPCNSWLILRTTNSLFLLTCATRNSYLLTFTLGGPRSSTWNIYAAPIREQSPDTGTVEISRWNLSQWYLPADSYHFAYGTSFGCTFPPTCRTKLSIHKAHLASDCLCQYRESCRIRALGEKIKTVKSLQT